MKASRLKQLCAILAIAALIISLFCLLVKIFQSHLQWLLRIFGLLLLLYCLALIGMAVLCIFSFLQKKTSLFKLQLTCAILFALGLSIWGYSCYLESCTRTFLTQPQGWAHLWFLPFVLSAVCLFLPMLLPGRSVKGTAEVPVISGKRA